MYHKNHGAEVKLLKLIENDQVTVTRPYLSLTAFARLIKVQLCPWALIYSEKGNVFFAQVLCWKLYLQNGFLI